MRTRRHFSPSAVVLHDGAHDRDFFYGAGPKQPRPSPRRPRPQSHGNRVLTSASPLSPAGLFVDTEAFAFDVVIVVVVVVVVVVAVLGVLPPFRLRRHSSTSENSKQNELGICIQGQKQLRRTTCRVLVPTGGRVRQESSLTAGVPRIFIYGHTFSRSRKGNIFSGRK